MLGWTIIAALVGGVIGAVIVRQSVSINVNLVGLLIAAGIFALGTYAKPAGRAADLVMKVINVRSTLTRIGVGIAMATVGAVATCVHLRVFDRLFVRLGRVEAAPMTAEPLKPETPQ